MTDVIEGMARAILANDYELASVSWEDLSEYRRGYFINQAQAAMDYLKQPQPDPEHDHQCYCQACVDWRAMNAKCILVRNWSDKTPASKPSFVAQCPALNEPHECSGITPLPEGQEPELSQEQTETLK